MPATGSLRRNAVELAWGVFALANFLAMIAWPSWETIPFHFVWISLTIVYGFRVWSPPATAAVLATVILGTGVSIGADAFEGIQLWGELFEVPLMSAMFLAMVWHARRRQAALHILANVADTRASLLERQERFLQDASHELRTPLTIARGHLELLRIDRPAAPELAVALDELGRMEHIIGRLLLLAKADQPGFIRFGNIDVERFLEDVFMRWSEVAERTWRLDVDVAGIVRADEDALRSALDALLENSVQHTDPLDAIELRAHAANGEIVIEVADEGYGVPVEARERIFNRFARVDDARARAHGGVGLGLSIVAAIAAAHGGRCSLEPRERGTIFALHLPVSRHPEPESLPAPESIEAAVGLTPA